MTGLDENVDKILEVAAIITDLDFNTVDQLHRVIYQPPEVLATMNDWCKHTHQASGLSTAVPNGTPLDQVENELIALIGKHFKKEDRVVIAGNSISNDRRFIDKYLVQFAKLLHYRMIDVSSFKEVFREKYGISVKKADTHRALDDIIESVKELKHYLSFVKLPQQKTE